MFTMDGLSIPKYLTRLGHFARELCQLFDVLFIDDIKVARKNDFAPNKSYANIRKNLSTPPILLVFYVGILSAANMRPSIKFMCLASEWISTVLLFLDATIVGDTSKPVPVSLAQHYAAYPAADINT